MRGCSFWLLYRGCHGRGRGLTTAGRGLQVSSSMRHCNGPVTAGEQGKGTVMGGGLHLSST